MSSRAVAEAQPLMTPEPKQAGPETQETPAPVVTLPVDLPNLLRELENAYIQASPANVTHASVGPGSPSPGPIPR